MSLQLGLIGVRGFGEKLAEAASAVSSLQLSRCFHPDWDICQQAANRFHCEPAKSLDSFFSDPAMEAVVIATPTPSHFELITQALEAGKHLFVEKPLTLTVEEALQVGEHLKKKSRTLMVGHSYRRKAGIRRLKTLIEKGILGRLVSLEINFSHGGGFNLKPSSWRTDPSRCPGGPLSMLGTHAFDALEYLAGPVKTVDSRLSRLYAHTESEDTSCHLIELASGATAYIANHYNIPSHSLVWVAGTEGLAWTDLANGTLFTRIGRDINRLPSPLVQESLPQNDILVEEMEEFATCVAQRKEPETGFREGLRATAFVHAALASKELSRKVVLDELIPAGLASTP